jgi:hypothetical protein
LRRTQERREHSTAIRSRSKSSLKTRHEPSESAADSAQSFRRAIELIWSQLR